MGVLVGACAVNRVLLIATLLLTLVPRVGWAQCSNSPTPIATVTPTPTITATPSATPSPVAGNYIKHLVFIVKENHTFDQMFGTLPNANGVSVATLHNGVQYPLTETPATLGFDPPHDWTNGHLAFDNGAMDDFDLVTECGAPYYTCLSQYHQSDVPNYFALAQHFAVSDNFFSSEMGPSFPNHLFTIAGQADNVTSNPTYSNSSGQWGCDDVLSDAGQTTTVQQVQPNGSMTNIGPCLDFPVLPDLLDPLGITWTQYYPGAGVGGAHWNAFDAISHIRYGPDWAAHMKLDGGFVADAKAGNLPTVSWVVLGGKGSDHPAIGVDECYGENGTISYVNAVMQGPEWASTAIFVTFDDWGGFYDHVPPPQDNLGDLLTRGFRVPLVIISPWVKPGYISSQEGEFSSLLTTAEHILGIGNLGTRDATANDLLDSFDFTQTPIRSWFCH